LRSERAALQTELNVLRAERGVLEQRIEKFQLSIDEPASIDPPPDSDKFSVLRQRIGELESERDALASELETLRADLSKPQERPAQDNLSFFPRDEQPFNEEEYLDSGVVWSAEVEGIDEIQNEDPIVKSYMRFLGER
jgi:cell division protein FtsB